LLKSFPEMISDKKHKDYSEAADQKLEGCVPAPTQPETSFFKSAPLHRMWYYRLQAKSYCDYKTKWIQLTPGNGLVVWKYCIFEEFTYN
jgi:hypothetical protein